jgi:hypothetical protein
MAAIKVADITNKKDFFIIASIALITDEVIALIVFHNFLLNLNDLSVNLIIGCV